MTDEMSRIINTISLPYGTKDNFPIKPKTGWRFDDEVPEESIPESIVDILQTVWSCAYILGVFGGLNMNPCLEEICVGVGRRRGLSFRLREIHYDALHGLGPLGPILMAEREKTHRNANEEP